MFMLNLSRYALALMIDVCAVLTLAYHGFTGSFTRGLVYAVLLVLIGAMVKPCADVCAAIHGLFNVND